MSAERDKAILIGVSCFSVGFISGFLTLVVLLRRLGVKEEAELNSKPAIKCFDGTAEVVSAGGM